MDEWNISCAYEGKTYKIRHAQSVYELDPFYLYIDLQYMGIRVWVHIYEKC